MHSHKVELLSTNDETDSKVILLRLCSVLNVWSNKICYFQNLLLHQLSKQEFSEDGNDNDDGGEGLGCETAEGWDDLLMDSEVQVEDDGLGMDTETM